jgi:hypothetical protein
LILHIALIKQAYAQEVMMLTILIKKFLMVLMDKLKQLYTPCCVDHLQRCIFFNVVSGHAKHIPVYEFKQWYGQIFVVLPTVKSPLKLSC